MRDESLVKGINLILQTGNSVLGDFCLVSLFLVLHVTLPPNVKAEKKKNKR